MKTLFALVVSILAFSAVAAELDMDMLKAIGNDRTRWVAHSRGAETRECFRVVDNDGMPVTNANVRCAFKVGTGASGLQDVYGVTDTNGLCTINGMCKAYMDYSVVKDGYYCSHEKVDYMETTRVPAVIDGKWQPYGETRTVVLKKIRNPIRLRDPSARYRYSYPDSGKWAGFDLVCGDWMPPMGNGKRADMMIRYVREPRPNGYFKSLDISFTNNPYAGVYLMDKDSYSEMDSVYEANTNGEYVGSLRYEFERTAKGNHMISELGYGQYLVFRIRTEVDDDGNLISAHYGRIMGALQYLEKGGMVLGPVFFNPTPNDTNLEDAETARRSRIEYRRRRELEWRRKNGLK